MTKRQKATQVVVLGVALTLSAQAAHAALIISATIGGVDVCASDNNLGCTWGATILDVDPAVGSIPRPPEHPRLDGRLRPAPWWGSAGSSPRRS